MAGKFDLQGELKKLREKGKKEEEISEWYSLASEIVQQISSKQLIPTMRTQYMRVAFQIPFDATVRVSLDTNLTMINERTKETLNGTRWYGTTTPLDRPV
jgi:SPX domain protein involved in polyphosphate accumulation